MTYNFSLVAVSIALATFASGVVLFLVRETPPCNDGALSDDFVSREKLSVPMLISGSVLMGLGMSAMQLDATPLCNWKIVAFSGIVAIGGSLTGLWLGFQTHTIASESSIRKLASAVVMGIAIAGMHYTAIAAVTFQLNTEVVNAVTNSIDNRMAITIGIATLILLAIAQRLTVENTRIEALRQSTNRFRCLEQKSSDVIQALSAEGIVTYTSSSIQRILGYTPDEWQGKQATALVAKDNIHHIQNLLREAMLHPATKIVAELWLDCADGTTKDCEAIANLSEWIEEDLDTNLTDETRQQMNLLRQRVHRLKALIDGLLQYSRVGRFDTPPTAVSVGKLLTETIDSLAPPETFAIHIAADMPNLVTHHLLLTQV